MTAARSSMAASSSSSPSVNNAENNHSSSRRTQSSQSSRSSSSSSSSSSWSTTNLVFLSLTLLGIGIIGGYGLFYMFWKAGCADLVAAAERRHRIAMSELQDRYRKAADDYQTCLTDTDDSSKKDLQEMSSRLENQLALASKHVELEQTLQETVEKLRGAMKAKEESDAAAERQLEELNAFRMDLQITQERAKIDKESAQRSEESLKNQLKLSHSLTREKIDEVEHLKSELAHCQASGGGASGGDADLHTSLYEEKLIQLKADIRQRSYAQAVLQYGKPPYRIQFTLSLNPQGEEQKQEQQGGVPPNSFLLEIDRLDDMPHTIHTLLYMVEQGLYKGTSLTVGGSDLTLEGGSAGSAVSKQIQSKLNRRYAELGYSTWAPVLVEEISPRHLCVDWSFGFVEGKGPAFVIPMQPLFHADGQQSCFGTIVAGREMLSTVAEDLTKLPAGSGGTVRARVTIADARIVHGNKDVIGRQAGRENQHSHGEEL